MEDSIIVENSLEDIAKHTERMYQAVERIAGTLESIDFNGILAYTKPTEEEDE